MPAILNTPQSVEPTSSLLAEISQRPNVWAAGAIFCTPWVINTWAVPLFINEFWEPSFHGVVFYLLAGLLGAEFSLAMIWVAWGGWRLIFRSIIVAISAAVTYAIGTENNSWELSMTWLAILSLGSLAFALPRLIGIKLRRFNVEGRAFFSSEKPHHQFSLRAIFVWTFFAALIFALLRWIDLPEELIDPEHYPFIGIFSGILVVASTPSIVVIWCDFGPLYCRIIGALVLIAVIVGIVNVANDGNLNTFLEISTTFWLCTALIMAVLAVPRALGYRLVWR